MPERHRGRASSTPARYRIVVRGPVPPHVLELLEETTVGESESNSVLTCEIIDQAKLQAVLGRLHDAGVEIVSFEPADEP